MDMVFKNNKIIATVIFLTFNIVCILFYFFGIFNDLSDSFYHKFCEFLYILNFALIPGEFKHEVRQFEKSYDNQQAEQISLMV